MTKEKDHIRQDRGELERALKEAGVQSIRGNAIKCPFHDDRHASGSIYRDSQAVWRVKCHGCQFNGDAFDVRARARGVDSKELLRDLLDAGAGRKPARRTERAAKPSDVPTDQPRRIFATLDELKQSTRHLAACHEYTRGDGEVCMVVLRIEEPGRGKRFLQCRTVDGGGFVMGAPPKPWMIYNLEAIREDTMVVVVEGEKCANALMAVGITATTSPGGAGKASLADWSAMAGKVAILWPDNDPPNGPDHAKPGARTGIDHMREVAAILERLTPPAIVRWINPDALGLPPKGDVVDYIAANGGTVEQQRTAVECALGTAKSIGAASEVKQLLEDTITGKRRAVGWPYPFVERMTLALLPGTVTTVCGDPSAGKSFWLLDAATYWHEQGEKWAIYELEEPHRAYYLNRVLAMWSEQSSLTDPYWIKANPDEVRRIHTEWSDKLDSFGRNLHVKLPSQTIVSMDDVIEWVKQRAAEGCRVIGIDPITAAATGDKPWQDDQRFILAAESVANEYQTSIILVTHPRKGAGSKGKAGALMGLDDLAGGAAYQRFCQNVLWLSRVEPDEWYLVARPAHLGGMHENVKANRKLHIRKARNARGTGKVVAFYQDPRSLRFAELGQIIGDGEEVPS